MQFFLGSDFVGFNPFRPSINPLLGRGKSIHLGRVRVVFNIQGDDCTFVFISELYLGLSLMEWTLFNGHQRASRLGIV